MAKPTPDTDSTIEALLEQRTRYEQWLAKLDSTGDKAPPAVRARVRSDYEARLRGVIDQLRGHAATISEELERHKASQAGLDQERRNAEEALAEAEVRYAVGEYEEDEWKRISDGSNDELSRLRNQLRGVGEEIARLAEVQALIGGAPKRSEAPAPAPAPRAEVVERAAAPAPAPAPPPPEPEPEPAAEPEPVPVATARPAAKPARPREPEITHGTPPADELAFLKSVSEDERKPAPPPAPAPAGRRSGPGTSGRVSDAPATTSQTAAGKGGGPGVAKTLKCAECGTLNRPTEWYCERCGAELAGI